MPTSSIFVSWDDLEAGLVALIVMGNGIFVVWGLYIWAALSEDTNWIAGMIKYLFDNTEID